ncbi:MAG: hypothetical protein L0211_07345, partial [Planctomycetaceae bacterium]|nr:hypothetical protein [Planctomycetaceae bacterium]
MRAVAMPIVLVLLCAGGSTGLEPTAQDLANPAWWFARARAEMKLVTDPEQQALVGSMISGA